MKRKQRTRGGAIDGALNELRQLAASIGFDVEYRRGGLAANPRRYRIVNNGRALTGWMSAPDLTATLGRVAVRSRGE